MVRASARRARVTTSEDAPLRRSDSPIRRAKEKRSSALAVAELRAVRSGGLELGKDVTVSTKVGSAGVPWHAAALESWLPTSSQG